MNPTQPKSSDKSTVKQDIRRIKWFVRKRYIGDSDVEYMRVRHLGNRVYEVDAKVWDSPFASWYLELRVKVNEDGWIKILKEEIL